MLSTSVYKATATRAVFACDGGAIFLKTVALLARGENNMYSYPHKGDATAKNSLKQIARNSAS